MPKKSKPVIGIDIGKSGGVAVIGGEGEVIFLSPFTGTKRGKKETKTVAEGRCIEENLLVLQEAIDVAKQGRRTAPLCFMEMIYAGPMARANGMITFGKHSGAMQGYLFAKGIPVTQISPAKWKNHFELKGADKTGSIGKVKGLYPALSLKRTERSKIDSDGLAEAVLIALYGYETQS